MKQLVKMIENANQLRVDIYQTENGYVAEKFNQGVFLLREEHGTLDLAVRHGSEWVNGVNFLNE